MRRLIGSSLCVAGGLLVSLAGGRYAMGAVRADSAREQWERAEAEAVVARSRSQATPVAYAGRTVPGAPVARVLAPSIGLDAIVLEGVDGDELNAGPGHLPGSVLPGERGNSVISAHRDRHFNHLDGLHVGDTVVTESLARRTEWVIVGRRVIGRDSPALFRTPDATLTLTTCWPMGYVGPAPERLILTAKPVPRRG